MKGLDLFLVLLVLLSWRRRLKLQEALSFSRRQVGSVSLLVIATTGFAVCVDGSLSQHHHTAPNIDRRSDRYHLHHPQEEFLIGNSTIVVTTISSINEKPSEQRRTWNYESLQQSPQENYLTNKAHYTYAGKHNERADFDFVDNDDVDESNEKEDETDDFAGDEKGSKKADENDSFPLPSWIQPPSILVSPAESIQSKLLEHRSLQRYLRQHHKQHIKRRRFLEQQERLRIEHEEQHSLKNDREEDSLSPQAHHYYNDHDPSWKKSRKHHGKRGKRVRSDRRGETQVDQNHRDHHSHPTKSHHDTGLEKEETPNGIVTRPKLADKKFPYLASNKVFRHSNRFLDKFYMDTQQGYLDPDNLISLDLNVSTISELIWKLRGMRSRRRRSFQAANNGSHTRINSGSASSSGGSVNFNNSVNSNTIDPQKLILSNVTWPLKRIAEIEGDIWLGGLMMVHEREDNITCGPIMPQVCRLSLHLRITFHFSVAMVWCTHFTLRWPFPFQ